MKTPTRTPRLLRLGLLATTLLFMPGCGAPPDVTATVGDGNFSAITKDEAISRIGGLTGSDLTAALSLRRKDGAILSLIPAENINPADKGKIFVETFLPGTPLRKYRGTIAPDRARAITAAFFEKAPVESFGIPVSP